MASCTPAIRPWASCAVGRALHRDLVGTRTVLTAAHCVTLGNEHTFTTDDGTIYRSLDVHRHPGFDPDPEVLSSNDVALIVLDGSPPITPEPSPPALPFWAWS